MNPYVQWVPVKYYFVTWMEHTSLDRTWAGPGVGDSGREGVIWGWACFWAVAGMST